MIVSPAAGGGASQILKISHPASASPDQLQSLAQSIISGKTSDANVVQIRPNNKPQLIAAKTSGNVRTIQSNSGKRSAQNIQQNKNVI